MTITKTLTRNLDGSYAESLWWDVAAGVATSPPTIAPTQQFGNTTWARKHNADPKKADQSNAAKWAAQIAVGIPKIDVNGASTIWTIPTATHATAKVNYSGTRPGLAAALNAVPVPVGVVGGPNSDHPLTIYDPFHDTIYALWEFANTGGVYSCSDGEVTRHVGMRTVLTGDIGGFSGSYMSGLAGVLTMADLDNLNKGKPIGHMLRFAVPAANGHMDMAPNVDRGDLQSYALPYGEIYRFSASAVRPTNAPLLVDGLFDAMQTYGFTCADWGPQVSLMVEGWSGLGSAYSPFVGNPAYAAVGDTGAGTLYAEWYWQGPVTALAALPWGSVEVVEFQGY